MDVGFKLTLNTPNGKTGRINHFMTSTWVKKHNLKMKYDYNIGAWNVTSKVTKKQWKELYKNILLFHK